MARSGCSRGSSPSCMPEFWKTPRPQSLHPERRELRPALEGSRDLVNPEGPRTQIMGVQSPNTTILLVFGS